MPCPKLSPAFHKIRVPQSVWLGTMAIFSIHRPRTDGVVAGADRDNAALQLGVRQTAQLVVRPCARRNEADYQTAWKPLARVIGVRDSTPQRQLPTN